MLLVYNHQNLKLAQFRKGSLCLLQVRSLGRFADVGLDVEVDEEGHDYRHVGHPDHVVCLWHCALVIVQINHVANGYNELRLKHNRGLQIFYLKNILKTELPRYVFYIISRIHVKNILICNINKKINYIQ